MPPVHGRGRRLDQPGAATTRPRLDTEDASYMVELDTTLDLHVAPRRVVEVREGEFRVGVKVYLWLPRLSAGVDLADQPTWRSPALQLCSLHWKLSDSVDGEIALASPERHKRILRLCNIEVIHHRWIYREAVGDCQVVFAHATKPIMEALTGRHQSRSEYRPRYNPKSGASGPGLK